MNLRFSSSSLTAQIQVVPDIDSEDAKAQSKAKTVSSSSSKSSSTSSQGLEIKLKRLQNALINRPESPPTFSSVVVSQPLQRQPVIRRLNHDARPLTAAEAITHRHLFPS